MVSNLTTHDMQRFGQEFLDQLVEWIKDNLDIGQVFTEEQITLYAKDECNVEDVAYDNNIKEYVRGAFNPEDVFDEDILDTWAINHGYEEKE